MSPVSYSTASTGPTAHIPLPPSSSYSSFQSAYTYQQSSSYSQHRNGPPPQVSTFYQAHHYPPNAYVGQSGSIVSAAANVPNSEEASPPQSHPMALNQAGSLAQQQYHQQSVALGEPPVSIPPVPRRMMKAERRRAGSNVSSISNTHSNVQSPSQSPVITSGRLGGSMNGSVDRWQGGNTGYMPYSIPACSTRRRR